MEKSVISNAYDTFVNKHDGQVPNVAYVYVTDIGRNETENVTIVLDVNDYDLDAAENGKERVVPFINDSEVYWYCCDGIRELEELTNESGADRYDADFIVTGFIGFEKL